MSDETPREKNPHAVALGRLGKGHTSAKKKRSSARNGKRPKLRKAIIRHLESLGDACLCLACKAKWKDPDFVPAYLRRRLANRREQP